MKALAIAGTSVRRLLRDRSNIFFVFILPMLLILVLGAAFGGSGDQQLGVVATDVGELGDELVTMLDEAEGLAVVDFDDRDALIVAVERGQLQAGLIVPEGYDETLRDGESALLEFVARPDQTAQAIRNTVDSALTEQGSLLRAAGFAEAEGGVGFSEALEIATEVSEESPDMVVEQRTTGEAHAFMRLGQFDMGAYSELVLFVFLTSMAGSTALIQSRQLGVSQRMFSTPTPVRTILAGEALGRFGVAMVQGVFIMVGTALAFGVDWGDPVGAVVVMTVLSLGAAGTAMLMGAVFKNDQQAGGIGVVAGLGLAALGGCMVPLAIFKLFSPTLWRVAHVTPHAWAIEAFEELILNGGGVGDVLPELGVLAAFAAVMFALASWRLRVTLTRTP